MDRDTKFSPLREFLETCTEIETILLPPKSPNCNTHLERFLLSLKSECVDRMIFFGEASHRPPCAQPLKNQRTSSPIQRNPVPTSATTGQVFERLFLQNSIGQRAFNAAKFWDHTGCELERDFPETKRGHGRFSVERT